MRLRSSPASGGLSPALLAVGLAVFLGTHWACAGADDAPPALTAEQQARLKQCDARADDADKSLAAGDFQAAIAMLEKNAAARREVLGESDPLTFSSMQWLARINALEGNAAEARRWADMALAAQTKAHDDGHWLVRTARQLRDDDQRVANLPPERRRRLREAAQLHVEAWRLANKRQHKEALKPALRALEIRKTELGLEHPDYLLALNTAAYLYRELNDFEHGEPMLRQCLEVRRKVLGDDHPDVAETESNLGWLYCNKHDYTQAEPLFRQSAETHRRAKGPWSLDYGVALDNLAEVYVRAKVYRRAEALRLQVLEIRKRVQGEEHTEYANALERLSTVYQYLQEFDKAEPLTRRAMEILRKNLGPKDFETISSRRTLAYIVRASGRPKDALPLDLESLDLLRQAPEPDHLVIAYCLSSIAAVYLELGDYAKAVEFQAQTTQSVQKAVGEHDRRYRDSLFTEQMLLGNLGYQQQKREEFAAARRAYEQQLSLLAKMYPPNHWKIVDLRLLLAFVEQLEKMPAETRQELAHAQDLFDEAYRQDNGKPRESLPLAEKALEIRRRVLGEEHFRTLQSLFQVSYLCHTAGDYAKSRPMRQRLPELCRKLRGEQHPDYAVSLHNLASDYDATGDLRRAIETYEKAVPTWKSAYGPSSDNLANTLNSLAVDYSASGDNRRAEQLYQQALEMRRDLLGPRHVGYGHSLLNLGGFYMWSLNDTAKAEPLIEQAVEVYKLAVGEAHPDYARGLDYLASLCTKTERFERAEALYRQALEIRKQALGGKHPDYAVTVHNLAVLYAEKRDYDKAVPLFREALAIDEATRGKLHLGNAVSLRQLAAVYRSLGRLDEAEAAIGQSVEICKLALGRESIDYAESMSELALVYALGDHPERSLGPALEAIELAKRQFDHLSDFMSERRQLGMRAKLWKFMHHYLFVTARAAVPAEDVYAHVLNWKGMVGASQQQLRGLVHRLAASGNRQVAELAAELERTTQSLAEQSRGGNAADRERRFRLEELSDKIERLQQQLAGLSVEFNRQQQQSHRTPDDIRKVLPEDAVLVDFLAYQSPISAPSGAKPGDDTSKLLAFVLRPKRPVERVELGLTQPVAQAIEAWRRCYGAKSSSLDPGEQLRGLLWKPLEPHLAGAQLLLVSPDSTLAPLAWAALPGREPGHYLIDDIGIAIVPVVRLLPELLAQDPAGSSTAGQTPSLLVVGDVDFGAAPGKLDLAASSRSAARGSETLHWAALPGTRDEIAAVEKSFGERFERAGVVELARAGATKSAVRREAGRHEYVHFSTHGFFAPPEVQAVLVDGKLAESTAGSRQNMSGYHPGLLSGLVLAGANRSGEEGVDDGILTALEVEELDLGRVRLATLSACETGLGQTAGGEGLLGLQRAFQMAGARSVVAGLWKVPDAATQALMSRFYANLWQKKMSRLEALRDAQRWMIREGAKLPGATRGLEIASQDVQFDASGRMPPFYWAAFVLSGDWR